MWLRRSVGLLAVGGVLAMVAWACDSGSGPRDINYNTDVGAGYMGPDVGFTDAAPEAGGELPRDSGPELE